MMRAFGVLIGVALGGLLYPLLAQSETDWLTYYEKSGYLETPRYEETIAFCQRLDAASNWVSYRSFGKSPQGRDLPLVIADKDGYFTPEAVRKAGKAVVLIQSGIHAGEIDGKDASLMLIRDMTINKKLASLLDSVTVLFIPIFNVDGHEKFGPFNRMNQNGPREMGFRATAQNLNLNRDFLKADAPEMRAWLALFNRWLPDFLVDNHVTDGADHQYVLTYGIETNGNVAEPLRRWTAEEIAPVLEAKMSSDGLSIMRYFSMKERPDLRNGLVMQPYSPRYSTGYGAVQNRVFMLVETHALKNYHTRVTGNYIFLKHLLTYLNAHKSALLKINQASDELTAHQLSGTVLPLDFVVDYGDTTWVDFLGIDYDLVPSEISGDFWVKFNGKPATFRVPVFNHSVVNDSAVVPYAYLIPQEWQSQIEILKQHGVVVYRLAAEKQLTVESYHLKNPSWHSQSFEGYFRMEVTPEKIREQRTYRPGTAVILMNQRTNRVIAALLEPHAPDSYISWGMWNTIFERKEYGEDYILEKVAREMLAKDPALKTAFLESLANNPDMAENRWARLYFFYAQTPYYEKTGIYPVGKLMQKTDLPLQSDQ
jgi:hypothetical protein